MTLPQTPLSRARDTPLTERVQLARQAALVVAASGRDASIKGDARERVQTYQENLRQGLVVVPEGSLLNPEYGYSEKRGPWQEFTAKNADMKTVRERILSPNIPLVANEMNQGLVIPSQPVGFRFHTPNSTWNEVLWSDALEAHQLYRELRKAAKVVKREKGKIVVDYGNGIGLTAYGLRRNTPATITAVFEGFPATKETKKSHETSYTLAVTPKGETVLGGFNVKTGFTQHRAWNIHWHRLFNGHISLQTPETNQKGSIDRTALYLGDLLGLYALSGIARGQYELESNQPLPHFPTEQHELLERIASRAILRDENMKRRLPNKTELSQLYALSFAQ